MGHTIAEKILAAKSGRTSVNPGEIVDAYPDLVMSHTATWRSVSVMQKPPRKLPRLPLEQPAGSKWEVMIIGVTGRFALSLRRRMERGTLYPNEVVEKHFGTSATTRSWNTIAAVCKVLGEG